MSSRLNPSKKIRRVWSLYPKDSDIHRYHRLPEGTIVEIGVMTMNGTTDVTNFRMKFRGCGELDNGWQNGARTVDWFLDVNAEAKRMRLEQYQDGGEVEVWNLNTGDAGVAYWIDVEIDDYEDRGRPPGDHTSIIPRGDSE